MFRSAEAILGVSRGYLGGFLRGAVRHRGIRIFRYHGVVEKRIDPILERNHHLLAVFATQMAYIRRFHVLGLEELLDALERPGRALKSAAAVVTFDDGFANNLAVAEVMSRHRLPWCLFVPVGQIGEHRAMWVDEFSLLLLAGDARRVEALNATWPLSNRDEREWAFQHLRPRLKALPAPAKREAMAAIRAQFPPEESRRLIARFPSLRMLTWRELAQLGDAGVEIGSHGVDHDIHHSGQPCAERLRELTESRRELEARLSRPCRAFAFPNGDFVAESPDEVASAGYAAAFTTEARAADGTTSRYLLPRFSAPKSLHRFVRVHWWEERAAMNRSASAAAWGKGT